MAPIATISRKPASRPWRGYCERRWEIDPRPVPRGSLNQGFAQRISADGQFCRHAGQVQEGRCGRYRADPRRIFVCCVDPAVLLVAVAPPVVRRAAVFCWFLSGSRSRQMHSPQALPWRLSIWRSAYSSRWKGPAWRIARFRRLDYAEAGTISADDMFEAELRWFGRDGAADVANPAVPPVSKTPVLGRGEPQDLLLGFGSER
jgi:hypothetical protein